MAGSIRQHLVCLDIDLCRDRKKLVVGFDSLWEPSILLTGIKLMLFYRKIHQIML